MRRRNWLLAGGALAVGASQSLVSLAFERITCAKRQTDDQCLAVQKDAGVLTDRQLSLLPEPKRIEIASEDNLQLRGWLLLGSLPVQRVIIMVHGYTATSSWMLHLAVPFVERGWTVLLVDQRGHGSSEGKYASYGYWEKRDLHRWVNWVVQQYGDEVQIGLFGQSMGGGTVLEYAAINQRARFIVADCAYSDMRQLIKYQVADIYHMPVRPLLALLDRRLWQRVGFHMSDVCPRRAVSQQADLPIMFIHGGADDFVPTQMSIDMFEQKAGKKRLLIVPGAGHVRSYLADRETYERELFAFISDALNGWPEGAEQKVGQQQIAPTIPAQVSP